MKYDQILPFNQSEGGKTSGACLKNTRLGFGIPAKYSDAWTAWQHTQQHTDRSVPSGVDVPIFFSYTTTIDGIRKNYGHIGVRLANGKFWSDGKVHNSIAAYEDNYAPVYVGWGESINDIPVIIKGDAMAADKLTKEDVIELHTAYNFGPPGANYDWRHVGQPLSVVINDFKKGEYRKTLEAQFKNYPVLEKKVAELEKNQNAQFVKVSDLYIKK